MLITMYKLFFLCLMFQIEFSEAGIFAKGEKKVAIEGAEMCPDYPNVPWVLYGTLRKFNRTHQGISGNVTIDRPLSDNLILNIEAQKWGDGGWKANALRLQKEKACTSLNEYIGRAWKHVGSAAGVAVENCPIPKGTYSMKDVYIDASDSMLIFMLGRFKYIVKISDKNTLLTCLAVEVKVTE